MGQFQGSYWDFHFSQSVGTSLAIWGNSRVLVRKRTAQAYIYASQVDYFLTN
jgi:hypothetical protein